MLCLRRRLSLHMECDEIKRWDKAVSIVYPSVSSKSCNGERNRTYLVTHLVGHFKERYSPRRFASIIICIYVYHALVYTACALPVACVCPADAPSFALSRCTHLLTECVYVWRVFVRPMLHLSAWILSRCTHLLTECVYVWCVYVWCVYVWCVYVWCVFVQSRCSIFRPGLCQDAPIF